MPARVDDETGYRYYSLEQLGDAAAIARLRALDVPLEECRAILAEASSAAIQARLVAHRSRLEAQLEETRGLVGEVSALIDAPEELRGARTALEKVEVKVVHAQPALTMRSRTTPEGLDPVISESINGVADYLRELGERGAGPPFTLSSDPDAEGMIEVAIGWPTSVELPGRERVEAQVLPSGSAAWAVYRGPYTGLAGAYRALYEWIVEHGHEVSGDPREIYYSDPDEVPDPADYVTGIVWPLRTAP